MPINKRRKKSPTARKGQPGAEYAARTIAAGKTYFETSSRAEVVRASVLEEPVASYTSRIRAIGNSKGVILNNQLIESAGLSPDMDILIQAADGIITIIQTKDSRVNTDLSSWDKQFKTAIKEGAKPDKNLFEGTKNNFDEKEW